MTRDDLLAALQIVHQELEQANDLDDADVSRLRQTMSEIQEVLDKSGEETGSFSDQINESARRFEESHPVLTNTLGRIADMLQQMGI
ncbi:hypothetical protein Pla52o_34890 [Novipirellula galeiformis]|uniref:DUF4404 domain-containing protein n=1 Tax=Novipirellula galeiformis TaxID=2528004 RepID=A0A5C6CCB2_9BACT|nr:DUF4404 family protein [Novipirellula galeiformis]TWU22433.1 hypothetical protein Pla52o_34890 [Novipirellula galeiformis]